MMEVIFFDINGLERGLMGRMDVSKDERIFAALIFGLSLVTSFIGPLILWLVKKDESSYVDYYGKLFFNFYISYFIYGLVAGLLVIILIGLLLVPVVGIAYFVFTIIAIIKAYEGSYYKIPFIIEIIK